MTPLLSALLHSLRLDRCRARFYLGGPRCLDTRGHPGRHHVFSGFAQVHWFWGTERTMTHFTVAHFFQDAAGEHRFQVKGGNGEIVVTSEGYTRPEDAVRGFERLRELLATPDEPADDAGYGLVELMVAALVIIVLLFLVVHLANGR